MTFPDDLAADFPPPRDDEPESLRQDIVDELSDHLHCALQRELLASGGRQSPDTTGEHSAYNRAITRFGNPTTLARRLWLDAMKEKIMAQRFTAVMAGITAVTAIVIAVFLWRAIDLQTKTIAETSKSNAALFERLITALDSRSSQSDDVDVTPGAERELRHLQLRLALDEPGGPPAAGYRLKTMGVSDDPDLVRVVDPQTDADGRATLSMNRIGVFFLGIETPSGESTSTLIPMGPNQPSEVELVVPSTRRPQSDVTINVACPDEFRDRKFLYEVTLD